MKIKYIFEPTKEKPFIVVYKPKELPSAPLKIDDKNNVVFLVSQKYPEILSVKGKKIIEYGLLHRLDTQTDGLLLIATTQECYDFLLNEQNENRFIKYYKAKCLKNEQNSIQLKGFPKSPKIDFFNETAQNKLCSYFRPFGNKSKEVRPVTNKSSLIIKKKVGKLVEYETFLQIKQDTEKKEFYECECKITKGFRHQVRCHLAWCGFPIIGDKIYNSQFKEEDFMQFSATKIEFYYPKGDLNSYEINFTWT